MSSWGGKGILVTGQPGTGKSLLQFYLLVELLMLKQLVLFTLDGANLYLFYDEKVYTISMLKLLAAQPGHRLPEPKTPSLKVFVWSLFDIRKQEEPEVFLVTPPCLPVQTASPDPSRYQIWDKPHHPLHTGLPLWTRDELAQGLLHQRDYPLLLDALRKAYPQDETDPLEPFPGVRTFLNDLQEDSAPSAEEALDHLLEAAIDRFGYSARDVFTAVFDFLLATDRHQKAFRISFAELEAAVSALANGRVTPQIFHRILTLSPIYPGLYTNVKWEVDFKSDWVAKCVLEELGETEDAEVRRQITLLRRIPEANGLAGYFLEPFAHRNVIDQEAHVELG